MIKIFTSFNLLVFLILLILGSGVHLMYGDFQTSKFHYICQAYWMPDYLPKWMIRCHIVSHGNNLSIIVKPNNYSRNCSFWFRSGAKYSEIFSETIRGDIITKGIGWNENGGKIFEMELKNGELHGRYIEWDDNGIVTADREFKDGILINVYVESR